MPYVWQAVTNLQGVWSEGRESTWNGDYHININLQMNYWPADAAALPEAVAPLAAFLARLRRGGGRAAAGYMYGVGLTPGSPQGHYHSWAGLGSGVEHARGGILGAAPGRGVGGHGRGLAAAPHVALADVGDGGEAWVAHGFMDGYVHTSLDLRY
jgi:hypothetical protein